MESSGHGGKREGAGRPPGIPNPNAGRPQTTKRVKVGDGFYMKRHLADGGQLIGELWTITDVSRTEIRFETRDGDIVILRK